jgi:hypothetical protein
MGAGDRIIPMDAEAIREWRENLPDGHSRKAYEFMGPGRGGVNRDDPVHDPDQSPEPLDPDRGFDLEPLPKGIRAPLETIDEMEQRVLNWVRSAKTHEEKERIREIVQHRVGIIRATSPNQNTHISDEDLESMLIRHLKAKARAATERVYNRRGWAKPQDFDLVRSAAPATEAKLLLPGQQGRRP